MGYKGSGNTQVLGRHFIRIAWILVGRKVNNLFLFVCLTILRLTTRGTIWRMDGWMELKSALDRLGNGKG